MNFGNIEIPQPEKQPEKPKKRELKISNAGEEIKKKNQPKRKQQPPRETFELKNKSESQGTMSRRKFLTRAGLGLLALGAEEALRQGEVLENIKKLYQTEKESEESAKKTPISQEKKESFEEPEESGILNPQFPCEVQDDPEEFNRCESEFLIQQKMKKFESFESNDELQELFDFDNDKKIEITEETKQKIFNRFHKYYRMLKGIEGGKYHKDIIQGLKRMKPWRDQIQEVFSKHGVPEKYAYISIAETHFRIGQKSEVGAGGPFQFIKTTGKRFGLRIDNAIDEREDPIKSAEAAAKTLKHLHDALGDWDLAVRGYNGGFVNRYRAKRKKEGVTNLSDHDFMCNYLPEILNRKKEITKDKKLSSFVYSVINKGATKRDVSKKFNEEKVSALGGGKFRIPLRDMDQRREIYKAWANADGIIQNLNYLGKVDAICATIEKYNLEKEIESSPLQFRSYTPKKETTLKEISTTKGVSLENLRKINPAILGPSKTIPKGYKIRLPLSYEKYASLK